MSATPTAHRGGRVAAGLLVGVPLLLLILATLGALTEETVEGLPVVPWQTLWALPLDRWIRDIAAALTLGFIIVGGLLLPRRDPRLLKAASLSAIVWLAALVAQVMLTVSELLGRSWAASLDPVIVQSLITQTQLGQLLVAQIVLVGLVCVLGWAVLNRVTGYIVLGLAIGAAVLPALTGHSGLHSGHTAASISLSIHLVSVGVWVGGLVAVCAYVARAPADADVAIRRFSALALVCVIALAESGLVNASLRMDGIASLITSPYGTLIIAKGTLLAALVVLGWQQRKRVVPQASTVTGRQLLLRLAAFEAVLLGLALGLSVALSRTAPPAGAIAGDRITSGALVLLTLGVPVVLVWAGARPRLLLRVTRHYPEPFAVLALVMAFVMAALVPSGALGIGVAALLASVLLVACGWAFAAAATGPRGIPAIVLSMMAWPALIWWSQHALETPWQMLLSIALAEALLSLLLVQRLRAAGPAAVAAPEEVSVA